MTRLHFPLSNLWRRAEGLRGMVRGIVERRALEALAEYQSRFDRARAEASGTLASLIQTFPNHEAQAKELFETNQFQALGRMLGKLQREARRPSLVELRSAVGRLVVDEARAGQQMSFEPSWLNTRQMLWKRAAMSLDRVLRSTIHTN